MKGGRRPTLPESEIDRRVVAEADDARAWERPVRVRRKQSALPLPSQLAARAAFFARLHRHATTADWLRQVIEERLDLEEAPPRRPET